MNLHPTRPLDNPILLELHSVDQLSEYLRQQRQDLEGRALGQSGGLELARTYSDMVDGLIRRMLTLAAERAGRGDKIENLPIAVVATGGYGRRELCPHSDIDITFIPHRDGDSLVDRIVKEMFTMVMRIFMDGNSMEVGYAYRLIEDCENLDHQTTSGLMDGRLIAGSDRLFIVFENDFWQHFNPAEYIFAKLAERRANRDKNGDTPRLIEPNIKEGAGGLRDLHTAVWLTQARKALTAADMRGERVWDVLARDAEVTPREIMRLRDAKEFLFQVRNALHVITGAEHDQLVVTRQEEVATALGYNNPVMTPEDTPPVEMFMREYYVHTAAIHRITGDITRRAENSRMFLGIGLDCLQRQIVPANIALGVEDPVWMLWACELAQKYNLEFGEDLIRAILGLLDTEPVLNHANDAAEIFTRMLAFPGGAWPILQKMAELGILAWILPEIEGIMNLISYDPSHDYTVGQHTLYVIRTLDSLRKPEGSEESRDFRNVMSSIPHPEQLYLAALLHDAGKSEPGTPHSESGEALAQKVCCRLGLDERASLNVQFLVRNHLLMSETSRLRDINLEETIRDFTAIVDDMDRLHMLYLLTYADTNAVANGIWTQVKGKFMRDLLHKAERALMGDENDDYSDAMLSRTRRRLLRELSVDNIPSDEVTEHVENMPANYILNADMEEIALHIGFSRRARQGEPVIDFHDDRNATFSEITICAMDDPRPGLLAKITGVFYAADLSVHSAQIFTRISGMERIAIDSFYADFRGKLLTPGKRREVASNMTAVLTGKTTVQELLAKRRKSAEIRGELEKVSVRNDLAENYTVVEVTTPDDRAMLYRTSAALSSLGWDIHSAKVSLFRARSVVSFYVTCPLEETKAREALTLILSGK